MKKLLQDANCNGPRAPYAAYFHYFNSQKFYEAHDVLEHLWLEERRGPNNNFFKALIQLAGAFVHLQKDRLKPAGALFRLSRSYLVQYPARHERLDISSVLRMIEHWLGRLTTEQGNPLAKEQPPRLELIEPAEHAPDSTLAGGRPLH